MITEAAREEAMYHLAVLLISRTRESREVAELLTRASRDGDYPQAGQLLNMLREKLTSLPCVCRRGLRRRLAVLRCPIRARSMEER